MKTVKLNGKKLLSFILVLSMVVGLLQQLTTPALAEYLGSCWDASRTSDTEATVEISFYKTGKVYYNIGSAVSDTSGPGIDYTASTTNTIHLTGLTPGPHDMYITFKDSTGNLTAPAMVARIPKYFAPEDNWAYGITATTAAWDNGGIINTAQELAQFAYNVNNGNKYTGRTITLGKDISLSGKYWTPIGVGYDWTTYFGGTFDGNGKKITGIKIGSPDGPESRYEYVGLFGYVFSGNIKNLGVDVAIYSSNLGCSVGGLVGSFNGYGVNGAISNCYATGNVTGGLNNGVGVLAGAVSYGTVINCFAEGDAAVIVPEHAAPGEGIYSVGGLIGGLGYGTISNCYAKSNVTGSPNGAVAENYRGAGGLLGYCTSVSIANCYATGNVAAGPVSYVGGLVGSLLKIGGSTDGTISKGYWNNSAAQTLNDVPQTPKTGTGYNNTSGAVITGMSSDDMKKAEFAATLNSYSGTNFAKWIAVPDDYPTFGYTDATPPVLSAGTASRTSNTAATVKFTSNEAGTYYYNIGSMVADTSGTGTACAAGETTISLASLTAGARDIYIAVKDAAGNVSANTFKITIPAYAAPDNTPPVLSAGTVNRTSDTAATVKFSSNEAGTYYYNIGSMVADTSGTGTACTTGETTITLAGLTAGARDIYIAVKDAAGNVSANTFKIAIPAYTAPDNTRNLTVIYNGNSNTGGSVPTDTNNPYARGTSVTVLGNTGSLERSGYTFSGWSYGGTTYQPGNTFTMPASNVTLTAVWTANYTVVYNANGGTGSVAQQTTSVGSVTNVAANGFTKTGCTFTGWNTAAAGTGTSYAAGSSMPSQAAGTVIMLYAQWQPNAPIQTTYTVTYDANGGTGAVPTDSIIYLSDAYTRVMGKGSLARNSYSFTGWNTAPDGSGTSYRVNDTFAIKGNVTLYAQWKVIDSAQIPVFTGSNVRGTEAVTKDAATITLSVTVAPVNDGGTITYQWYQSAINSTAGGAPITEETGSSYTPLNSTTGAAYYYVVVTNTAAGVPASSNTSSMKEVIVLENPAAVYNVSISSLLNITLSNPSATQYQNYTTSMSADSGYTLPNGIAVVMGGITLVPGVDYIYSTISPTTGAATVYTVTGEISVTAAGTPIPTQTYTISFDSNGADTVAAPISATCGAVIFLPTPAKAGYSFGGWYRDRGFATSYHSATMGKGNITLYAKWEQITYSITGNVKDENNANVSGSLVTLKAGSRQIAQATTDGSGNFIISGIPKGTYNLVVSNGTDQIITLTITVSDSSVATGSVTLPKGNKNSVVEVKQDTPDIIVDKLNDFFNSDKFTQEDSNIVDAGGTVEIKLLVEKKEDSGDNAAANADSLKTSAEGNGKTVGIFLNLTLSKIITPAAGTAEKPVLIDQLSSLLIIDIPLPAELQGKSGYVIYRYHGAGVQTITEAVNADDEYIEVNPDGTSIRLHAKKFSTYAVGYTAPSTPPTNNTDDGSSYSAVSAIITAEQGEGGKITISTDKKTATIIPDDGYVIADVTVDGKSMGATEKYSFTDSKAHKITAVFVKENALPYYSKDGAKVYIGFSAIAGKLYKYIAPAGVTVKFSENPKNFIDNTVAWAKPGIDFVTEREIFLGTGQNIFSPDEAMTRAMFVTAIGRLYEHSFGSVSGTSTFLDVDANAYYARYVAWANANGVIKGIGINKFDPQANVTREQMAVIMLNLATLLKKTAVSDVSLTYADSTSISSWAIEGTKYCQETKVIEGGTDGGFAPREDTTRAEASAILQRFIANILK
jgi:uncharacterized repeat protein (TIGR02543 family)